MSTVAVAQPDVTPKLLQPAAHVTQGIPWRGRKTQRRGVGYVAAEGGGGIETRLAGLRDYHPETPEHGLVGCAPSGMQGLGKRSTRLRCWP